jgi:hypothetical protein
MRLPAERAARRLEVLHEPAWRDLLDLVPGATQALADLTATRTGNHGHQPRAEHCGPVHRRMLLGPVPGLR